VTDKLSLPPNTTTLVLEKRIERSVWSYSEKLIEVFKNLMSETYEDSVEDIHIVGHSTVDPGGSHPHYWRYLGGKNKLVTNKRSGNFAGDSRDLGMVLEVPYYDYNDDAFFEHDYAMLLADALNKVTYDSWLKANGWDYPIPTTFHPTRDPGYGDTINLTRVTPS